MRDLDQLREQSDETAGRKFGLYTLAGVVSVAAAIALGLLQGRPSEPLSDLDPLAQLDLDDAPRDPKAPAPRVKPAAIEIEHLSFPAALVGDDSAIQEETARAAAAEHAAIRGQSVGDVAPRRPGRASEIPASTLAVEHTERLARVARHDPLVAQALPERSDGTLAPPGYEGAYTLQVIAYETREPAERFATALRARGHKAYIGQAEVPGRSRYYRVRIGPFASRREAAEYQARFEQTERMRTILVTSPAK